jgi:hypothetical protein
MNKYIEAQFTRNELELILNVMHLIRDALRNSDCDMFQKAAHDFQASAQSTAIVIISVEFAEAIKSELVERLAERGFDKKYELNQSGVDIETVIDKLYSE